MYDKANLFHRTINISRIASKLFIKHYDCCLLKLLFKEKGMDLKIAKNDFLNDFLEKRKKKDLNPTFPTGIPAIFTSLDLDLKQNITFLHVKEIQTM